MVIGSIDDKMLALQHCNFVLQLFITLMLSITHLTKSFTQTYADNVLNQGQLKGNLACCFVYLQIFIIVL